MKLSQDEADRLLSQHDHGVLATVHPDRGADAVPVVYVVVDGHVGIPVDRVKPKASTTLRRERNLDLDPRATLLVEHWNRDDWSALWWVRASLSRVEAPTLEPRIAGELGRRFAQYRDQPFERLLVFRVVEATGWSGAG